MVVVPSRKVDIRSLRCLSDCGFITNTGVGLEYLDSCFSISKQSPGLAIDGGLLTCICNKPDGAFPPIPLSLAIAAVAVQSPLQLPSLGR